MHTSKLINIVGSGLTQGDNLIIDTNVGKRGALLVRDGVTYNIFNCISRDSDWFSLVRGDNMFLYKSETGSEKLRFEIINRTAYVGV